MDNNSTVKNQYWIKIFATVFVVATLVGVWKHFHEPKSKTTDSKTIEQASKTPLSNRQVAAVAATRGSDLEKIVADIAKTKECYKSQNCNFSQSDPRAYDFAVGDKLAAQLRQLHDRYKNDPQAKLVMKKVALENFYSENGFVQEAALNIFKDFPSDEEILSALTKGIRESYNPLIVEMTLPELQKYLGTAQESQVHAALADLMRGAHFASQAVAKNILGFITPKSYSGYRSLLGNLSPQTQAYRDLKSALQEYERRQTGG